MKRSANSKWQMMLCALCFCFFLAETVEAQKFKYSIPGFDADSLKESFIVAGGSSTVLRSGQGEVIWNNSLTSYWLALHQTDQNSPIIDRFRATQFISDIFGFYGISESAKWDIGIHIRYTRTRVDNAASSSMFRVFDSSGDLDALFEANPGSAIFDASIGDISSVGLRFRSAPINTDPKFVLNGGFAIKTVTGEEKARQLAADRNTADIGFTYYKGLNNRTYYFLGGTFQTFFPSSGINDQYLFNTSVNFSLIQRPFGDKWTFYPGLSYSLAFKPSQSPSETSSLIRVNEFLFAFGGIQYAPTTNYNFFFTGGFPLISSVVNPQQEIVRASYSNFTLGLRLGF